MAFWNDALKKVQEMVQPKAQPDKPPMVSNRDDGGFSGYSPRISKKKTNQQSGRQPVVNAAESMGGMMPPGVQQAQVQGARNFGSRTGQTPRQPLFQGNMPPQQPQQGMPPQQPNVNHQPPYGWAPQVQQPYQGGAAPQGMPYQATGMQPQQGGSQPPMGWPNPAQPNVNQQPTQPAPGQHTVPFPGAPFMAQDGGYKLVFRVAQITGVTSCFRIIEFMHNNEAVIVNAEMITDMVEANRCMDLIFGAACAFGQRLIRVSGMQIYLITPPQVRVEPFEGILRSGMEDMDRRWPGARQMNMNPMGYAQHQQQPQQMAQGGGYTAQMRGDDFVPGGRRSSRSDRQGNYTDYGGFGMRR